MATLAAADHLNGINGEGVNGNTHINGHSKSSEADTPFINQYAFTPRKLNVVTIGAGFSGLLIAHKFQHRYPEMEEYVQHTIYEGHSELGGTWLVNTYPSALENVSLIAIG